MLRVRGFCAVASSLLVVFGSNVTTARSADVSGSGTVTYISTPLSKSKLPDGKMLGRMQMRGVVIASDSSVPIHLSLQDCTGSTVSDASGKPLEGSGSCNGIDKDGDVWWISWRNKGAERNWAFLGGTGKYQGGEGWRQHESDDRLAGWPRRSLLAGQMEDEVSQIATECPYQAIMLYHLTLSKDLEMSHV